MPAPATDGQVVEPSGLLSAFASRAPVGRGPWDRWDSLSVALALFLGAWLFAFKLETFYGLATTSDLYHHVQISRSWLEGRVYGDNEFGSFFEQHACFIPIPLGLLAEPFGAPGLLSIALAAALGSWGTARVLRALGVPGPLAVGAGVGLVAMPWSAVFFYHPTWAYAIELFLPPLALGLLHALLHRRLAASLIFAAVIIGIKEEMPIFVVILALVVLVEEALGGHARRWSGERGVRGARVNVAALACMAAAFVALPVLVHVIANAPPTRHGMGSFRRLPAASQSGAKDAGSLVRFVLGHVGDWLQSNQVRRWPLYVGLGTVGLIALRPHFVVLGIGLTVVSWLLQDQILWPPRFATTTAFSWCTFVLALASLWRLVERAPPRRARAARWALGLGLAAAFVGFGVVQARVLPQGLEVYRLDPWTYYTQAERAQADLAFAEFREKGRFSEPAIASIFLFRYAHDRDLYWPWALEDKPPAVWIIADDRDVDVAKAAVTWADYERRAHVGRFSLWKRLPGR